MDTTTLGLVIGLALMTVAFLISQRGLYRWRKTWRAQCEELFEARRELVSRAKLIQELSRGTGDHVGPPR